MTFKLASDIHETFLMGEKALRISDSDHIPPFLMHLITDSDAWAFIASNHAICAGRKNPDHSLFPYCTQDKLFDTVDSSGSITLIKTDDSSQPWHPFSNALVKPHNIERSVIKSLSGTKIALEELNKDLNLTFKVTWTSTKEMGIVRHAELLNHSDDETIVSILDGIQNVMPSGVDQLFQNTFSNLADAYKQSEWQEGNLALYSLSSIPTDKAEPNECLSATTVWSAEFPIKNHFLAPDCIRKFARSVPLNSQNLSRGARGCYLMEGELLLKGTQSHSWWIVADVQQTASEVIQLQKTITESHDLVEKLESHVRKTTARLNAMVGKMDGMQTTDKKKDCWRHFSNTLFNMMRGGTLLDEYQIPKRDLIKHVHIRNRKVAEDYKIWFKNLPTDLTLGTLREATSKTDDQDLMRIVGEYLPLSFSRRHGDPSRPWNRFNIDVTDPNGEHRYAYQGNWRDIFQNWEALLHSFPDFTMPVINRFLNATTFDGYNPYRITQDGFEWEREEPDSPWSNIGYWGDHQIAYLLKLLELSFKKDPENIPNNLNKANYAYAAVPYRIKSFEQIIKNARDSIVYDHTWSDQIDTATNILGADGQLVMDGEGNIVYATLVEKLLIPLLSKMSNFIPDAGIWMNTQRPEWNDANNALAGYGASVVTAGYMLRYVSFLKEIFIKSKESELLLRPEVKDLLLKISENIGDLSKAEHISSAVRGSIVSKLGKIGSVFRGSYYDKGISGKMVTLDKSDLLSSLSLFQQCLSKTLKANRRDDDLYHSYNLLRMTKEGITVENLCLMLEGQVSILSSGLLKAEESSSLLVSLRKSDLYRKDQNSYLLYPNRSLPGLLDKGIIDPARIHSSKFLQTECDSLQQDYFEKAPNGTTRFKSNFRNIECLNEQLKDDNLTDSQKKELRDLYEDTFHHHAFTGRSRSFFAYEGLGSIYWHMVSKLLLAVQEIILEEEKKTNPSHLPELLAYYHEIKEGIGTDKTPAEYGAFPTDPYSHTPAHNGAQQPGMTGQVKEDFLTRQTELGMRIENGILSFKATLITPSEFLSEPSPMHHFSARGEPQTIDLPKDSLAFTICNTPVIVTRSLSEPPRIRVVYDDHESVRKKHTLSVEESRSIFQRTGEIQKIMITLRP
ncbi:MAG: hypothetical protein MI748_13850 [Opitutales bacterium]|nr:hypothetical protein [Opitutales bacterium]